MILVNTWECFWFLSVLIYPVLLLCFYVVCICVWILIHFTLCPILSYVHIYTCGWTFLIPSHIAVHITQSMPTLMSSLEYVRSYTSGWTYCKLISISYMCIYVYVCLLPTVTCIYLYMWMNLLISFSSSCAYNHIYVYCLLSCPLLNMYIAIYVDELITNWFPSHISAYMSMFAYCLLSYVYIYTCGWTYWFSSHIAWDIIPYMLIAYSYILSWICTQLYVWMDTYCQL